MGFTTNYGTGAALHLLACLLLAPLVPSAGRCIAGCAAAARAYPSVTLQDAFFPVHQLPEGLHLRPQAAASQEVTPSGPLPLHAGPSYKAGRVRSPTGTSLSPTEPRPEPQAHPQLLTLSQVGRQTSPGPLNLIAITLT
jgi:hypothetical protein